MNPKNMNNNTSDLDKDINNITNQLVDVIIIVSAILGIIIYIISLLNLNEGEIHISEITDLFVIITLVITTIYRKKLNLKLKSLILLLIIFLLVFIDLLHYGLLGANKILFIGIPFFSYASFKLKKTLQIFTFANIIFILIAFLTISNSNPFLLETEIQIFDLSSWLIHYFELLIVSITILIISYKYYETSKNAFEELSNQNLQLESLVKERTIALKKMNSELKATNVAKDKFFRIIGHDLRNTFSQLIQLSELVKGNFHNLDDKQKNSLLNNIQNSSTQGMKFLDNLLQWAMTQTGDISFSPEKIHLYHFVNEVFEFLNQKIEEKQIKISNLCNKEQIVYADVNMLNTIFINLISNAIKFTNKNGKIEIGSIEKNENIEVYVKDNGVGIEKDYINHLFDLSKNYTTIGTHKETGTGLGLMLCKEFINKHKGKIWVESEIQKGSKFVIALPIK